MVVNSKNLGRYIKSIPLVSFYSTDDRMDISNLFDTKRDINEYLGLILLRLRFKAEDKIFIYNYDRIKYSFDCFVNDKDYYKIRFENIKSNKDFMKIVMNRFNTEFVYECIPEERTELGMKISLGEYSVTYPDGKRFVRSLSSDMAMFRVEIVGCVFELELQKPNDIELPLFDDNGRYSKYRLNNEEKIFEYLGSLNKYVSIIDIYKKLIDNYLDDLSIYPKFSLKIFRVNEGDLSVTDLINLKDGELENFGMTVEGKTIFLDRNGDWSFEVTKDEAVPVCFSMSHSNGNINCSFSSSVDFDIDDYTRSCLKYDVNLAQREIIKIKRRVRTLFNKKNSN